MDSHCICTDLTENLDNWILFTDDDYFCDFVNKLSILLLYQLEKS